MDGSRKYNVLIVDDESAIRQIMQRVLKSRNINNIACASGQEALEAITADSFDLVFSDVSMPEVTGEDVYTSFRKILPDGKFVFMSGYPLDRMPGVNQKLEQDKNAYFLKKPFGIQDIYNYLDA